MKLELKSNDGLYEKTELAMSGTAEYKNGVHERFNAMAFVDMYGAIRIQLTVYHPISLSDTTVVVTLNKAAFEKLGKEYNDMDFVIPLLVDRASRENNYGLLLDRDRCVGVDFDD